VQIKALTVSITENNYFNITKNIKNFHTKLACFFDKALTKKVYQGTLRAKKF